jgi:hypothetical protein
MNWRLTIWWLPNLLPKGYPNPFIRNFTSRPPAFTFAPEPSGGPGIIFSDPNGGWQMDVPQAVILNWQIEQL